jgi:hypothetical protein
MRKTIVALVTGVSLVTLWTGSSVCAQVLNQPKPWDIGDKATYRWVLNNKAQDLEEELTGITDTDYLAVQRVGGKTFEVVVSKEGLLLRKVMCHPNGQQCSFDPPTNFVVFPLEKGKKWTINFTVTGETFTSQVTQERVVEKVEKIKVPAGEFDAYRVSFSGRFKGTDSQGKSFSGREDGTDWIALVPGGKINWVKIVYRNSFGEKFTRELTSVAYKQ